MSVQFLFIGVMGEFGQSACIGVITFHLLRSLRTGLIACFAFLEIKPIVGLTSQPQVCFKLQEEIVDCILSKQTHCGYRHFSPWLILSWIPWFNIWGLGVSGGPWGSKSRLSTPAQPAQLCPCCSLWKWSFCTAPHKLKHCHLSLLY